MATHLHSFQGPIGAVRPGDELFALPDWKRPYNPAGMLAAVPTAASVKGMFWTDLQKVAAAHPDLLPAKRYAAFNNYPLNDYMRGVTTVATAIHPGVNPHEAIRRIGRRGFSVISSSLAGKVLFALAGRDLVSSLGLVSEAYRRCLTPGDARLASSEPGRIVIELRQVWNHVDSYQVGVFEGALAHFGHSGSVKVRVLSHCDADYLLEWC
jgi:uncharacterized protein (TIGR02265 family)